MKELFLIRHAKSSWDNPGLSDFDRPLNHRGEGDAPLMGRMLKENGIFPDLMISSPANRAITTARAIAKELAYERNEIQEIASIYHGELTTMLTVINSIEKQHQRVFIFGHNPTFTYLAEALGGEYIGNLPTCGVVGIRFEVDDWAMVSRDLGVQFYYDYPKRYK